MRTSAFGRMLKPSSMVAILAIAGCVGSPGPSPAERAAEIPATESGGAPAPASPVASLQVDVPLAPEVKPPAASGFSTRNAYFQPVTWAAGPGWQQDDPASAWDAFRKSCEALARREVWRGVCARAATVAPGEARRRFFEQDGARLADQPP